MRTAWWAVSMDMVTIDLTPLRRAGLDAGFGSKSPCGASAGNGRRAAHRRGGAGGGHRGL